VSPETHHCHFHCSSSREVVADMMRRGAVASCGPLLDPRDELEDIRAMKSAVEEKDSARGQELERVWAQVEGELSARCMHCALLTTM
jgi:hypothetical protein